MPSLGGGRVGETAATQARLLHPNVILLDLMLPDFDGLHVIQAIRLFDATVPFLVLSNYSEAERVQAVMAPASQLL